MTIYNYTRELVNGAYNIDNLNIVDANGVVVPLASIVQEQFPANGKVSLKADAGNCDINIEIALDAAEETQLDGIVADYKNGITP